MVQPKKIAKTWGSSDGGPGSNTRNKEPWDNRRRPESVSGRSLPRPPTRNEPTEALLQSHPTQDTSYLSGWWWEISDFEKARLTVIQVKNIRNPAKENNKKKDAARLSVKCIYTIYYLLPTLSLQWVTTSLSGAWRLCWWLGDIWTKRAIRAIWAIQAIWALWRCKGNESFTSALRPEWRLLGRFMKASSGSHHGKMCLSSVTLRRVEKRRVQTVEFTCNSQ